MGLLKLPRIRHRRYRNMNIEPGLEPLIAQWICRAIMRSRWTAREALQRLDRSDLLPYIGISEATEDPDNMDEQEFWNLIKSHIGRGGRRRLKHGGTVYKNVEFFSRIMDLEQVEQEVLYFAVILGLTEHFKGFLQELFTFPHLESLASFVGDILGLPSHEVLRALNKNSTLVSARIINGGRIGARGEPLDVLEGLKMLMVQRYASEQELLDNFFQRTPDGALSRDDFPHLKKELDTVVKFISGVRQAGTKGANVLFYGPPGTGKTELCRVIAAELGMGLYEVSVEDDDGDGISGSRRFTSYMLCQRFLARHKSAMVLFDECEDVFPMQEHPFFGMVKKSGSDKGFTNRLLETNAVPTIWCTNHIGQIDPAFLRRFDLHLEVGQPPQGVRERILEKHFEGIPVGKKWLAMISRSEDISPADMERAAKVAKHLNVTDSSDLEDRLEQALMSRLQTTGRRLLKRAAHADTAGYSLDFLNTDCNIERLANSLGRKAAGSILMYGPPGTGKTALAQHLSEKIGRQLIVRKASDLLSKWVGESEHNIARMFTQARTQGAVLLLDEADSFLRDRRGARASWEVTQVNELLVQMEEFEGLFICSTNLIDNLDQASFRRFGAKIRFDYLKPGQCRAMFESELKLHGIEPGDVDGLDTLLHSVERLQNLTPGDFATVRRKLKMLDTKLSPKLLYEMLTDEITAKHEDGAKSVGF